MLLVQGSSRRVAKRGNEVNRNSNGTADLVQDLKRGAKVDLVPCPFLAALFNRGVIKPDEDGTWSKADAYRAIDTIIKPLDDLKLKFARPLLKQVIAGDLFGRSLPLLNDTKKIRLPFNEWPWKNLHMFHTGIRLPKVIGTEEDPMNFKGPCGNTLEDSPTCGEPGVHLETFEKLVEESEILSKKEETEKWTEEDVLSLCSTTKATFYAPDDPDNKEVGAKDAYYKAGGSKDACALLFGVAVKVFDKDCNGITKQDWKNFLVHATFPACYVLTPA